MKRESRLGEAVVPPVRRANVEDPCMSDPIRNLGADSQTPETPRIAPANPARRSILDAPFPNGVRVCSPATMRAIALLLALAAVTAIACGSSNQNTHDGTTVTMQQPGGPASASGSPASSPPGK
jgi:hypothetical protein